MLILFTMPKKIILKNGARVVSKKYLEVRFE